MAQAACKLGHARFYRWSWFPSKFFHLGLIREGNSQTVWIIKKLEMESHHVVLWHPTFPDGSVEGKKKNWEKWGRLGPVRHLIGSNWGQSFLLLLQTAGRMGGGQGVTSGWLFTPTRPLNLLLWRGGKNHKFSKITPAVLEAQIFQDCKVLLESLS